MIFSMTGFGSSEYKDNNVDLSVEIKSLNNRFFEASIYLPEGFGMFENRLREKLSQQLKRGRVFLYFNRRPKRSDKGSIIINKDLAHKATNELRRLGKSLGISKEVSIDDVIALPSIIKVIPQAEDKAYLWPKINALVDKAIKDLKQMRRREGLFLFKDLNNRIKRISSALGGIEAESPRIIKRFQEKLKHRLRGKDYSAEKLVEEVGTFSRNIDISEEIVRLKSHIYNFRKTLSNQPGEKGRTLDFIAQEMQREINTIGAKSQGVNISKRTIAIKSEIEKIREQLSNVE